MRLVVIGMLVGLTGCGALPNDSICTTPPPLAVNPLAGAPAKTAMGLADDCVHRWGYRLAGARDDALTVAKAVAAGCESGVSDVQRDFKENLATEIPDPIQRRRVEDEYDAFVVKMYLDKALFHVVQARAGNCRVPK